MEKEDFINLFKKSFAFFEQLSPDDSDFLFTNSKEVNYAKGEHIHDGTECTGVILVRSGCLRVYMLSEEGKEITLFRLFPGDMCMLSASCVLKSITFDVFVDSEEKSECVVISGIAYSSLTERRPEVKIFTLETAVSRFSEVMWAMQQILFMSFDRRLAIFLLDESSKTGSDTIKLTHEQIAKYIGSAREVVTRMLGYFSQEDLVSLSRSEGIKLKDKKRLLKLASENK